MRFVYNNRKYEVMEMHEIGGISCNRLLVLFEIQYAYYKKDVRVLVEEKDFVAQNDYPNFPSIFEEKRYVNFFPQDSWEQQDIIDNCIYFIDHEYKKNFDECKYFMRQVRKAQIEFEMDLKEGNNTKGSLDRLEYAQSDLYDYIRNNIEGEDK